MREYENLIIFHPDVGEEAINNQIEKLKKFIEEGKGKCISTDKWGFKKLAYPIKGKQQGYYILLNLSADRNILEELNRELILNQKVMRHCIIKKEGKKDG